MISWLQTVIQRHHKILFSVLLVLIIIAFVFTVGNFGGIGPAEGDTNNNRQEFYGYNLGSQRVVRELSRKASISMELQGIQLQNEQQFTYSVLQRALALHLADQLQIPGPSNTEFIQFFQKTPAFVDPQTGIFSQNLSQRVIDQFNNNPELGEPLLTSVLVQDYRIEKVLNLLSGPGYVVPAQAESTIKARKTDWTLDVATLSRAEFKPQIDLGNEAVAAFFEQRKAAYKPEDKVLGGYVSFDAANFESAVKAPTDAELQTFYAKNIAQWPKNGDQPKPFGEIKEIVAQAWKKDQAIEAAADAANKLTLALYNSGLKNDRNSLEAFLKGQNLSLKALPAFNRDNVAAVVSESKVAPIILDRIFGLKNQQRFYSDAVETPNGAALVFYFGEQDQPVPALADVRERVLADYNTQQLAIQFAEKSQSTRNDLQKALAEGKSFTDAAKALGLTVKQFGPFSLENPPADINPYYLFAVINLKKGELSQELSDAQGSSIVYVANKQVPDVSASSTELQETISQMRPMLRQAATAAAISELIEKAQFIQQQAQQQQAE